MNITTRLAGLSAAVFLTALAPTSFAQVEGFELTSGIPSDFFLVVGQRNNPENQFLCDNWGRVHDAFMETGILEDLIDLASAENPEAAEGVTQMFNYFAGLFGELNLEAFGQENIYGQRLNVPVFSGQNVGIGAPDMVWLFKSSEAAATQNFNAIVGLMNGGLGQLQAMAGVEIALETITEHGMEFSVLDFAQLGGNAPDFPISVGHKGGILTITLGSGVRTEVAALLAGVGEIRSINTVDRFQSAFKGLPKAETSFEYTDMPNLASSMGDIFGMVRGVLSSEFGGSPPEGNDGAVGMSDDGQGQMIMGLVNQGMDLGMEAMNLNLYSASVSYTVGATLHTETRAMLAPNAKENRFYPLLMAAKPIKNFPALLPASTTGYSVKAGQDLNVMYDFALEMVGEFGPMGQELLGQWAGVQEQSGFDLRRDVLSWVGGETISANFTINGKDAWVTRMRVADEDQAKEKLGMALGMIPMLVKMAAEENPMANMLGVRVSECRDERFPGYSEINIAMAGQKILCGVQDGWLTFSGSGDAIAEVLLVSSGGAESALTNEALGRDALFVEGPVLMANFSDYSQIAPSIADGIEGMAMMGSMVTAMIEDRQIQKVVTDVVQMVGRLVPVIEEIDFFRSGSSVTSFDGRAFYTHSITNYVAPAK